MIQGFGFGVIDHVNMTAIVPTNVNPEAWIKAAEPGHADGISGGVVATE